MLRGGVAEAANRPCFILEPDGVLAAAAEAAEVPPQPAEEEAAEAAEVPPQPAEEEAAEAEADEEVNPC